MSEQANNGEISKLMALVLAEVGHISKSRKNVSQGFQFRGIDDIYMAMHPILSKHGVVVMPEILAQEVHERPTAKGSIQYHHLIRVGYKFVAPDGSYVTCVVPGEAMDMGDKGVSKAMSVAYKYAMFQVFCIPVEGATPDPDEDTPEETTRPPITEEQKLSIEESLEFLYPEKDDRAEKAKEFVKWSGADPASGVNGINTDQAKKIIGALSRRINKKKGEAANVQ